MTVIIKPVKSKADLSRFIKLPYRLYKGNKYWCPPMRMDERNTLDPEKNRPSISVKLSIFWHTAGRNWWPHSRDHQP